MGQNDVVCFEIKQNGSRMMSLPSIHVSTGIPPRHSIEKRSVDRPTEQDLGALGRAPLRLSP